MKKAIQNNKTYTLNIYNHATGCFETVEVTEEVYRTYQRTAWNIEDNDASFYAHEIQFSSLIGGSEDAFQNFREFIDTENTPDRMIERTEIAETLRRTIGSLTEKEQALIYAIYFDGLTEREYARLCGVAQPTIHKMKQRILKKNKKISQMKAIKSATSSPIQVRKRYSHRH